MKKIAPYGDQDPYAIIELIASTQTYSTKFNTDQMPVLAARVSHANSGKTGNDKNADITLMNYLAKNKHETPFEHQSATFRVVAPIFVFREWHRHRTQSYNEVSMRYSSDPVGKFFQPEKWRKQATRNKQSSADDLSDIKQLICNGILNESYKTFINAYNDLIDMGVCKEQARIVVPVGNYSEMYATANLRNWAAFCKLRCDKNAQYEIRQYANAINTILSDLWIDSWNVMKENIIGDNK